MVVGCEPTDDRWRYMLPIMLLFSAVVYLYWRICAVCLPAPLLPRPLRSWPSLSCPSPHPLPDICLPLLLLQQCGVLCPMLCRLWRECCHDNVEVAFCMELFTKGVLYRFGHVKCDVSLVVHVCLHGEDPLLTMSKVISKGSQGAWQADSLDGIGCLHLEGEYAHCHPPLRPSILGALWCHTALISQVGLKRCCYGTYCLSEGKKWSWQGCCIYPSPGWAWASTLILWMRSKLCSRELAWIGHVQTTEWSPVGREGLNTLSFHYLKWS